MIQCKDCKYCKIGLDGRKNFTCDPFGDIIEPECIQKWQLIRLDMITASYQATLKWYEKIAPLQDKMFKYMQKEIDDIDESEKWKIDDEDSNEDNKFNS